MNLEEEYRLSEYQDLGRFNNKENLRLKRHKIYGTICVEKKVSPALKHIYDFLKSNPDPNIPQIYECILVGDVLVIIEEYVTGRNLEDIVCERKLSESDTVKIALELCKVLKKLHNANPPVICRDIKAENVMIDNKNRVKLVDFSIARTFQQGKRRDTVLMGTAEYAAPEQFGYFQTDNRTDIYALGILINYMVTGKFPVEQKTEGRLLPVVRKSTYIDPKERYQTIEELEGVLKKLYPECIAREDYDTKANEKQKDIKSFKLPGFRSGVLWKKAVAVLGYLMVTYMCFSMEIKRDGVSLNPVLTRIEQTAIWISQLVLIGVIYNYRGWRDKIPFLKNKEKCVRIVGYIAVEFILLFIAALICVLFEEFLA